MYNFDEIIDRTNTNAMKLEGYKSYIFGADDSFELPFKDNEFIHMWVADMEWAVAPEIIETIKERADKKILGYTANIDDSLFNAVSSWCKEKYDWDINREEFVTSDGVVTAIERIIEYAVPEGKKVLFNTPAYGQFALATERVGREYITSKLIHNKDGSYDIDFADLDEKMGRDDVGLFILCSPHNPTGRIWTKEELEKLADLIKKHHIWVISDEIHCDIRRTHAPKHLPFAKVLKDYDKMATCMATSKTFNLAGLQQSAIFIRNKEVRDMWNYKYMNLLNPLSNAGTIAAYTKGQAWLDEMTAYLDKNFKFMEDFIEENLNKAVVTKSDTTYLGWVDFRNYFEEDEDIELFFAKIAGVLIEADKSFVEHAKGMVRLNLACPRSYLEEGLERMADALNNKHKEKFTDKR